MASNQVLNKNAGGVRKELIHTYKLIQKNGQIQTVDPYVQNMCSAHEQIPI